MINNSTDPSHLHFYVNEEGTPFEEGQNPYPSTPESIAFYERMRQEIEAEPDD
ncbi:MAG: hypothetical protein NC124_03510 [Clostridium sp.]|nr:hypothetical protein [Clostridium sp.]